MSRPLLKTVAQIMTHEYPVLIKNATEAHRYYVIVQRDVDGDYFTLLDGRYIHSSREPIRYRSEQEAKQIAAQMNLIEGIPRYKVATHVCFNLPAD